MRADPLWTPNKKQVETCSISRFQKKVENERDLEFKNYSDFHKWSVNHKDQFWNDLISYYNISYEGSTERALIEDSFLPHSWFPDCKLNFAENLLKNGKENKIALNFIHESGMKKEISYKTLRTLTAKMSSSLSAYIKKGDVVAAFMPNIPETIVSMLATTSLGGVFTSTSCDFGIEGILDRFSQSRPKVLVAAVGYEYGGKYFDLVDRIAEIEKEMPFLEKIILVDFLGKNVVTSKIKKGILFESFLDKEDCKLTFKKVSFSDPLYIMYSSGTTGKPKCIIHSVGGTLLQHVKELGLHSNLDENKNILYFTTCGWMMWNWLASSLYFGATITLYEGSPGFPSLKDFFSIIEKEQINIFGTSPKFLRALEESGYNNDLSLDSLETILSTGAPLLADQFDYVYEHIKKDIMLASICGGTDIIGCFMLGNPSLPVYRGNIQCLGLGMDVSCFDEDGAEIFNREGELVCKTTFPSCPISFLNDEDNEKITNAYFSKYPNIWYHGDFVTINNDLSVTVFGRSDATLNPGGVRIGTSEIYRQTEVLSYLSDSLCVGRSHDGDVEVILFVKMKEGINLDEEKLIEIKKTIKAGTTPRHVPKEIIAVKDIPYTRSGKKMELAISRILNKKPLVNRDAVANPECLNEYEEFIKI